MTPAQTAREASDATSDPAEVLAASIENLRGDASYQNYLRVRNAMLRSLSELDSLNAAANAEPSSYWREELGGFDYMLDASPLIIEKLREHCHHITGDASYRYRQHHSIVAEPFEQKLARLVKRDKSDLLVPEERILGGYGHEIDGKLINIDTLKFYECMIALDRAGFLDAVKADSSHKEVWLEIGAGWGGFGHAVKKRFPALTYVIVDLPQTMIFSATYLMTAFPEAKVALYPEVPLDEIAANLRSYDFVFLPHYLFDQATLGIDLGINMVSFQEMTTGQVSGYLDNLARMGCKRVYSLNRDKSAYNDQLTGVTEIIGEHFAKPRLVNVLPYAYTILVPPKIPTRNLRAHQRVLRRVFGIEPRTRPQKQKDRLKPGDYRHLVAERSG